jgi:hypothetical protein
MYSSITDVLTGIFDCEWGRGANATVCPLTDHFIRSMTDAGAVFASPLYVDELGEMHPR